MTKQSFVRKAGALKFPLGPMTCFKILSLSSRAGFQICTFFPFAVTMVGAC